MGTHTVYTWKPQTTTVQGNSFILWFQREETVTSCKHLRDANPNLLHHLVQATGGGDGTLKSVVITDQHTHQTIQRTSCTCQSLLLTDGVSVKCCCQKPLKNKEESSVGYYLDLIKFHWTQSPWIQPLPSPTATQQLYLLDLKGGGTIQLSSFSPSRKTKRLWWEMKTRWEQIIEHRPGFTRDWTQKTSQQQIPDLGMQNGMGQHVWNMGSEKESALYIQALRNQVQHVANLGFATFHIHRCSLLMLGTALLKPCFSCTIQYSHTCTSYSDLSSCASSTSFIQSSVTSLPS